jgi:hypothetical protein
VINDSDTSIEVEATYSYGGELGLTPGIQIRALSEGRPAPYFLFTNARISNDKGVTKIKLKAAPSIPENYQTDALEIEIVGQKEPASGTLSRYRQTLAYPKIWNKQSPSATPDSQ